MRFLPTLLALTLAMLNPLRASDFPTVKAALPDLTTAPGEAIPAIDLRNHFEVTGIVGPVVQFPTTLGTYNLELLPAAAPVSVANFRTYVTAGRYEGTFVHRSDQGLGIIQGGGYGVLSGNPLQVGAIATNAPIVLEYNLPNARGTISMARTNVLNSATSQWFINTRDNTTTLGVANGGGYAVFGRVTGSGMAVVDAIQALQVYAFASPYGQLPLTGYAGTGGVVVANLVSVNAAQEVPVFPTTTGQNAVVTFSVTNTNPALVAATAGGSTLTLGPAPGQSGIADLTVIATDSNGNTAQRTFRLNVLSFAADTDGDGLNDASERLMAPLGFDWQVSQPALVTNYYANASGAGLFTPAQVRTLNVGVPLIQKSQTSGRFKLTIGVKQTTALGNGFSDLPLNVSGGSTVINAQGRLEFEFNAPGDAAFFRLEAQ